MEFPELSDALPEPCITLIVPGSSNTITGGSLETGVTGKFLTSSHNRVCALGGLYEHDDNVIASSNAAKVRMVHFREKIVGVI